MDRAQRLMPHFLIALLIALSSLFPLPVFAKDSCTPVAKCDEGIAYQMAWARAKEGADTVNQVQHLTSNLWLPDVAKYSGYYQAFIYKPGYTTAGCSYPGVGNQRSCMYYFGTTCSSRSSDTKSTLWSTYKGPDGSVSCIDGCEALNSYMADGTVLNSYLSNACHDAPDNCSKYGAGWHYNAYFQTCEPPQEECPDGQTKGTDGKCKATCPSGMVQQADGTCKPKASECPAGQVKAPDGSCIDNGQCPAGQTKGADGTCKPEKPPEEDGPDNCPAGQKADANGKCQYDESFSGGDDCSMPPTCSGSPILCGQARIQWRIDCNTRKNTNVSGGTCASVPVCTGEKCDAVEYAQLIQQWKTACALEKLAAGGATDPGDTSGQPDWTKVTGMSQDPGAGASADDTKVLTDKSLSPNDLDQGGFGGGSCMGFVSGSAGGDLANGFAADLLNPPAFWCNYVAEIKAVMILLGAVAAAYILSRPT